jgi:hypothetical protein
MRELSLISRAWPCAFIRSLAERSVTFAAARGSAPAGRDLSPGILFRSVRGARVSFPRRNLAHPKPRKIKAYSDEFVVALRLQSGSVMNRLAMLLGLAPLSFLMACTNTVAGGTGQGGEGPASQGTCVAHQGPGLTTYSVDVQGQPSATVLPADKPALDLIIEGEVQPSSPGTLAIDPCASTADCTESVVTVTLSGQGLPSTLVPPHALVRLHYHLDRNPVGDGGEGQATQTLVENLPTLNGATNAVSTSKRIWLVVHGASSFETLDFDPFQAESVDVCASDVSTFVGSLAVDIPGAPHVVVPEGAIRSVDATGDLEGHYTIQNTINETNVDAFGSVGYWIVGS